MTPRIYIPFESGDAQECGGPAGIRTPDPRLLPLLNEAFRGPVL